MVIYVVRAGDTVDSIAADFGVSVESLLYNNQIMAPYRLAVGQALLLGEKSQRDKRSVTVNGYAYPFISEWVLNETLPYLTGLLVFSYGFTWQGDLLPPPLDDQWMINAALESGAMAVLTLTPLGPDGMFNNRLISALVNNLPAQENLLFQLAETMEAKGFGGLDIDFEFILAGDRDEFTAFVEKTTGFMNARGYQVSVALAPKTSTGQKGSVYEGKDYPALGAAANSVLLMTYEWGYTYGPPMAVAPINQVRRVVEYAVTEIPREKIDLGIPNYGYDWPLPFVRGVTAARTLGNIEAVQLAITYGAEIQFDESAQSPFFYYWQSGVRHEVWFEDVRSMQAKFDLIQEFGLRGAGYWQIMKLFRANWLLLADNFWIGK